MENRLADLVQLRMLRLGNPLTWESSRNDIIRFDSTTVIPPANDKAKI